MLLVVVGSSSAIKISAVSECYSDDKVEGVPDFQSGVPPQPIGKDQTIQGATFRANHAKNVKSHADIWVGIENGMFQMDDGKWVDAAAIVIIKKNGDQFIIWSDSIDIPNNMEKGPNGEWSILKDPHIVITGKPRAKFIAEAIKKWMNK